MSPPYLGVFQTKCTVGLLWSATWFSHSFPLNKCIISKTPSRPSESPGFHRTLSSLSSDRTENVLIPNPDQLPKEGTGGPGPTKLEGRSRFPPPGSERIVERVYPRLPLPPLATPDFCRQSTVFTSV